MSGLLDVDMAAVREASASFATSTAEQVARDLVPALAIEPAQEAAKEAARPFAEAAAESEQIALDAADLARDDRIVAAGAAANALTRANTATAAAATATGKASDAVAAASSAQTALGLMSSMIAGAAALGTKLSAADGFADAAIAVGKPFFVAVDGNAVLYVKGSNLAGTVPSTNPALTVPGVDTLNSALSAVDERLPLDGSVAMTGSLPLGDNAILNVRRIDMAASVAGDDDYLHVLAPIGTDGEARLFAALNCRTGLLALGALEDESLARLAFDLYGSGVTVTEVQAGDENLVDLFALPLANGQTARSFAVNVRDGTVSIGALDDESRERVARDLYGAGVAISTAEPDEAGIVDLFGLKTPEGFLTRSVGVNPRTGEVALGALDQDSLARLAADLPNSGRLGTAALAPTITLIPQAGQSLATGEIREASLAADEPLLLSGAPLAPNCWMLNTGLRGVLGQTLDVARIVDFVPAQDEADGSRGQVPGSAMMARLHAENCRRGILHDMVWRGHAQGGRAIAQLSEGTAPFENGIREIERAIAIAARYGREVELPAIIWTQGEQDRTTPEQTYFDALIALRSAYNARLLPLLPAGHPQIALVMDQVSASSYSGAGTPAQIAQYRAARDVAGFYLVGPHYQLALSDSVHLRAKSYAILGEYQARCWHEVFRLGKSTWRPVMPLSAVRSGTAITLTLNRPYGGNIVLDTDTLPMRANYGFEYSGANIVGVQITNAAAGIVRIDLDAAAPGTLSYAWTSVGGGYGERAGAWGNIRDDSAVRAVTLPRVALPNWLVTFQEIVA